MHNINTFVDNNIKNNQVWNYRVVVSRCPESHDTVFKVLVMVLDLEAQSLSLVLKNLIFQGSTDL